MYGGDKSLSCLIGRSIVFTHAIMQDDILFIPDAMEDRRFARNPLVLGPPFIRFYAGKPLVTPAGEKIGTVCLIDSEPRKSFDSEDRKNLSDLAALVMDRMEMRRLDFARTVSQIRFENIAATSPDAIICSNEHEHITFWNKAAEKLFGYSADEIAKLRSNVIIPESLRRIYEAELQRLKNGERLELEDRTMELSGLRKDGTEFPSGIVDLYLEGRQYGERRRHRPRHYRAKGQ